MLRMKALLLLAVATVAFSMVFAGCSGVSETEPGNGVGTTPPVDTTLPSSPTGLTGAAAGSSGANLSWSASTDSVGVTGYIVRRNGVQVATPATTSFADTGLSAATTYSYTVAARDAAGNISPDSASMSITTASAADTTPPTTPTGLTGAAVGSTGANLSWSASTDNVGVTGYIVRRNGVQVATPATTSFADTGLSAATTYSYAVAARDAAGNISPNSTSVSITTASPADTTPPTTPTGLTGAAAGSTGANLSWSASTDNVGVTGYIVRRNGVQVATPSTTSFADTGLSAATTYSYTVAARDAAGNISPDSASVSVTTPPPQPSNSASLAWDAVTAAPNLSGYRVYFGSAPGTYLQPLGQGISVGNVTAYTLTGLASGSLYYFAVTAFDTLGMESPYSNEVSKNIP
jgi:chitodextrinase